jgi:hypothetical protein
MSSGNHPNTSLRGGTKLSRFRNHKMASILCDGQLRDFEELNSYEFATYCKGVMETGKSHHHAFMKTEGVDPEWPLWYADYIQGQLGKLLQAELTKSEIIYLLLLFEEKRTEEAPESKWTEYYAKKLVDRYLYQ